MSHQVQYKAGIAKAFRGEEAGVGFFGALASRLDLRAHRNKLEMLVRLEGRMMNRLRPIIEHHAIDVGSMAEARREGSDAAPAIEDWNAFVQWLLRELPFYIAAYRELAAQAPPIDREAVELLVAHEIALWEFGEREDRGRSNDSLQPIEAMLRRLEG